MSRKNSRLHRILPIDEQDPERARRRGRQRCRFFRSGGASRVAEQAIQIGLERRQRDVTHGHDRQVGRHVRLPVEGEQIGTIGVLGPTRMDYRKAQAAVSTVSHQLGQQLSR